METAKRSGYDVFLSHAGPDKPWATALREALGRLGAVAFLDATAIDPGDNYVLRLNDGIANSRFLVLLVSKHTADRDWVVTEWTAFMNAHGPLDWIVPVLIDAGAEPPVILGATQWIDALDRDVEAAALKLMARMGRAGELSKQAARTLSFGEDLRFVIARADDKLRVTEPSGAVREVEAPWSKDNAFGIALRSFADLTRKAVTQDAERAELHRDAKTLGQMLFELLFEGETKETLLRAMVPGARPLVTVLSDDDVLLSLPWELLHEADSFLVREGKIDLVRSTPGQVDPKTLPGEPTEPFSLVVNVSAPSGSKLQYEAESYRITRALSERCTLRPTELGTLKDLVETVNKERPTGIHFSGHGGPGALMFENDEGDEHTVPIDILVESLKEGLPGALPPFFYLASCHGNTPAAPEKGKAGSESSAARLHKEGVAQVVGYYGPIADELSTRAEEALYAAIADGETTLVAVRQARTALSRPLVGVDREHRPAEIAATREPSPAALEAQIQAGTHPFAWAQLVLFQRGLPFPLSTEKGRRGLPHQEVLQREFDGIGDKKRLTAGFIGRRTELHRARKQIRKGRRVFVFQGLGGLGKTTLAFEVVRMLAEGDEQAVCTLWCQGAESEANPVEALVGQLLDYCRKRFGGGWEQVVQQVDRVAGDDSLKRFAFFAQTLVGNVERLVIYLDNLESLLVGPDDERDEALFADWRTPALKAAWGLLCELAESGGKLHVVASCRYRNDDLREGLLPVSVLPADALYRLMGWFPGLRALAGQTRARLVNRLEGHPRAVEYANDLVVNALNHWRDRKGDWSLSEPPSLEELDQEWAALVAPALPKVQEKLWGNLLLEAIWDHVLSDKARRMLARMTLLRGSWEWDLACQLGEPDEPDEAAEEVAQGLRATSLLEQVELGQHVRYTLHPATVAFVKARSGEDADLERATHLRAGEFLEARVKASPYIETYLEAGHHLFQAGEYDRAYELLGSASDWLQERGRVREGLGILVPFLEASVQGAMSQQLVGRLLGTVGLAYANLGQVEKAIGFYEQQLVITREIGDRRGEGSALGNLGSAYAGLGQVEKAIGFYEQCLVIHREIGDRRGEGNAVGNLGSAYANLGQVDKAIGFYEQQLVIVREIGDRRGEGNAVGNLGSAYYRLGQVDKAIGFYEQALVIDREIGDRRGEGADLGNLGLAYANLGHVDKAIGFYEQRLVIAREIGDRRGEGNALGNLGIAYARLGQVDKAIALFEQALAIGQAIKDPQIIRVTSAQLAKLRGAPAS